MQLSQYIDLLFFNIATYSSSFLVDSTGLSST